MANQTIIAYLDSEISRLSKEKENLQAILIRKPYAEIIELQNEMSEKYSIADTEKQYDKMEYLLKDFNKKKLELLAILDKQENPKALIKQILEIDMLLTFLNTQKFNESIKR
jgi:hypothetical protein